jgi:hypothetical protein
MKLKEDMRRLEGYGVQVIQNEIAKAAYDRYLRSGITPGHKQEDRLDAEQDVLKSHGKRGEAAVSRSVDEAAREEEV